MSDTEAMIQAMILIREQASSDEEAAEAYERLAEMLEDDGAAEDGDE